MNKRKAEPIRFHEDTELFREAIQFTAAETGFLPRLIEKDYFCTIVLQHLCEADPTLIFKGGTCLAKVHTRFYRLSEDLDFSISLPADATRSLRSRSSRAFKLAVEIIPEVLPVFEILEPVTGANNSKQYVATIRYPSRLSAAHELIKIEVGLREPMLTPAMTGQAKTLLLNPIRGTPMLETVPLACISRTEAMAEKIRAALSRRDVAIRDFYDIDHAARNLKLDLHDAEILALLAQKLAVPDNEPVDMSETRLAALRDQIEGQLRPVLRSTDFASFDLPRAFDIVRGFAASLRRIRPSPSISVRRASPS